MFPSHDPQQPVLKEVAQGDERAIRALLAAIGCPEKRARLQTGTNCPTKGANFINSGMKNATPAQLKNFALLANRAKDLGRSIMKFGIIPEAMYVASSQLFWFDHLVINILKLSTNLQ